MLIVAETGPKLADFMSPEPSRSVEMAINNTAADVNVMDVDNVTLAVSGEPSSAGLLAMKVTLGLRSKLTRLLPTGAGVFDMQRISVVPWVRWWHVSWV